MQVSDWITGQVVGFRNTSKRPIIDIEFNPKDKYEISTGAYNCVSTWYINYGSIILKRVVTINSLDKSNFPFVTCLIYLSFKTSMHEETNILTANNFGDLGVIAEGNYYCTKKTAHKKMINSLIICNSYDTFIVTGGEDEFIKVWNTSFELLAEFNLRTSNIVEVSSTSDV
jgi:WD40 repeat protein